MRSKYPVYCLSLPSDLTCLDFFPLARIYAQDKELRISLIYAQPQIRAHCAQLVLQNTLGKSPSNVRISFLFEMPEIICIYHLLTAAVPRK